MMKKAIYILAAAVLFSLYLVYSYNLHLGKSYIFEPFYITLKGDFEGGPDLKLAYQTVNDPTLVQYANVLTDDSIPGNTYIFKIDSSYRVTNFSIYFQSIPVDEQFSIEQIKGTNIDGKQFDFSLLPKDLIATGSLTLEQSIDNAIMIRKIATDPPTSSALTFYVRSSFDGLFVRTSLRVPVIPSVLSFIFIVILGILMAYFLYLMISNQNLKKVSIGSYILALGILILPTGEKVCNLLFAIAILAGIVTSIRDSEFRTRIRVNLWVLLVAITTLMLYLISFYISGGISSGGSLLAIKLGLPMTLVAVTINTNNKDEVRIQYVALLTGVIVSVFIHFGWIVMLADAAELKHKLLANPHHYLETSVFSRIHHSYLSLLYLVSMVIVFYQKDILQLRKTETIIYSVVVIIALVFAFSRSAILTLGLICIFQLSRSLFQLLKIEIVHVLRIFSGIIISLALLAFIFTDLKVSTSTDSYSETAIQTRIQIWEHASDLIKQKPITGWGPVNYEPALQAINSRSSINNNTWTSLNTHNQFLETSGMFGLVVGMALIWFLAFPTGFSRKTLIFSVFLFNIAVIFVTGFLFESFLNRNLGVLIFGLVYGLLIKANPGLYERHHL